MSKQTKRSGVWKTAKPQKTNNEECRGVNIRKIPQSLRHMQQWITWRREFGDEEKPKKIPYSPKTGRRASTTRPADWSSFDAAVQYLESDDTLTGLGFVFTGEDPYVGIDLDNCLDDKTGELEPWAENIVRSMASYTEVTPSGRGLHIIARGSLPAGRRRKGQIEMYEEARYFSVTGQKHPLSSDDINDAQTALESLHTEIFGEYASAKYSSINDGDADDDDVVLESFRKRQSNLQLVSLFDSGNWEKAGYPSQSEADLALCGALLQHCSGNQDQTDRLFRRSALYRQKWDEKRGAKTYGQKTMEQASNGLNPRREDDSNAFIRSMNERFAVTKVGGKVAIMHFVTNPETNQPDFHLLGEHDFKLLIRNVPPPPQDTKKSLSAAAYWLLHPDRRQYEGIIFAPNRAPPGYFNLWRGFSVQPKEGDVPLFWDFVATVICNGNDELCLYVRKWMAHMVQRPEELPETALVLRGEQGTGKSTFVDIIGELVKSHYLTVTSMDQVTGRFNSHLKDVILLHAAEAVWGGWKAEEGTLKSMITDPRITIEYKGKDIVNVANYKRLIISSNEEWAAPRGIDDRRFVICDVSAQRQNDSSYFAALRQEMKEDGLSELFYQLLYEPLEEFHPRQRPNLSSGLDMKLRGAGVIERWLYEALYAKQFPSPSIEQCGSPYRLEPGWQQEVSKEDVTAAVRSYAMTTGDHRVPPPSQLFRVLRKILPGIGEIRPSVKSKQPAKHSNSMQVSSNRPRMLQVPSLEDARTAFAKYMHQPIDWPED